MFFIEKRHRSRWVAVNTNAAAERKDKAPTPEPIAGIKNGIALIPALFMGAGLVIIVVLYRITPQKHTETQAEITVRSAA